MLFSMANLTVRRTRVITKASKASEKHPNNPHYAEPGLGVVMHIHHLPHRLLAVITAIDGK